MGVVTSVLITFQWVFLSFYFLTASISPSFLDAFPGILATKKPHSYKKITVWPKDDQIRKSPLKFYNPIIVSLASVVKLQLQIINDFSRHLCIIEVNTKTIEKLYEVV